MLIAPMDDSRALHETEDNVVLGSRTVTDTGVGRIEHNSLCEVWLKQTSALELCVVIFRVPEATPFGSV